MTQAPLAQAPLAQAPLAISSGPLAQAQMAGPFDSQRIMTIGIRPFLYVIIFFQT